MYCDQCGQRLSSGARFCDACGAPIQTRPLRSAPRSPMRWVVLAAIVLVAAWWVTDWLTRPPTGSVSPSSTGGMFSKQEHATWTALLEQSTPPSSRPAVRDASAAALRSPFPSNSSVRLRGRVVAAEIGANGTLLRLDDGTGVVLVAYPGAENHAEMGARVTVIGQALPQGIFADELSLAGVVSTLTQTWTGVVLGLTASWVLALFLLIQALWMAARRRRAGAASWT